ncbi:unnamed protein product [Closterium sp. NIES-53]
MASSDSSVDLATIDALELLGDNSAANWHSYAHSVEVLLSSVIVSGYTLRSVVFQEEGGLQPIAPSAPTGPPPDEPGPEPEPPGDSPSFAPDVNNPQSLETAIRAYRNTLHDHLRRQLRYEDDKRTYDEAAVRHSDYHAQLTMYTTRLANYTSDIAAWRIADRRALAILLATIPSSLKRELSPTSSSHLWQLLVDLFDREDIATLYALIKEFGSITMDSTAGAAAFTRRKRELCRRVEAELSELEPSCKDLGELQHYLGMTITRDRSARTISLSQGHYLQQVLERFAMARGNPQPTPLSVGHHLSPPSSPSPSSHPYPELIGSLMYAMVSTRPDLAYPISVLARFVGAGKHTEEHWQAAKRVLRYIRGTKDYVLTLGGPSPPLLNGYSDSSWADSRPDQRSSQGYGFSLGSGLISWRSTRSSAVALSSCEAELYAATMAAQEARWLTFLLDELGAPQRCPTIWCDNASTIHLAKDAAYHGRSKHIELRFFFIRELVEAGHLRLGKIDSAANLADIFTKALPQASHSSLLRLLGLTPPPVLAASCFHFQALCLLGGCVVTVSYIQHT